MICDDIRTWTNSIGVAGAATAHVTHRRMFSKALHDEETIRTILLQRRSLGRELPGDIPPVIDVLVGISMVEQIQLMTVQLPARRQSPERRALTEDCLMVACIDLEVQARHLDADIL